MGTFSASLVLTVTLYTKKTRHHQGLIQHGHRITGDFVLIVSAAFVQVYSFSYHSPTTFTATAHYQLPLSHDIRLKKLNRNASADENHFKMGCRENTLVGIEFKCMEIFYFGMKTPTAQG